MSGQPYWYNLTSQSVERSDERPEDAIGPFGSAAEAEESPALLIEHARAWLESEESERFREMAEGDDDAFGTA
jgi:hypothetical protein